MGNEIGQLVENLQDVGGKKVWYVCPSCKQERWALESFAGTKCWDCMVGKETASTISTITNKGTSSIDPEFFDRFNRYVTMSSGYLLRPIATFKKSNYKVLLDQSLYDKTNFRGDDDNKNDDSGFKDDDIIYILTKYYAKDSKEEPINKDSTKAADLKIDVPLKYKQCEYNEMCQKCAYLWTLECPIYKDLGYMLETDDYFKLRDFMPIIKSVNKFINTTKKPNDLVTYRGSYIVLEQFNLLEVGNIYRITKFLATSESSKVADSFIEKNGKGYKIIFNIDKNNKNAANICQYSEFQNESEVLLMPYTPIKISKLEGRQKTIHVVVLNHQDAAENVPSIVL